METAGSKKLFICWAGTGGKEIAEAIGKWVQRIIPQIDFVLSTNIGKGKRWFDEVDNALTNSQGGIVCLTAQAIHSSWIHFEAGALSRALAGDPRHIFPLLIGVSPEELTGPLTAYQATQVNDHQDMLRLAEAISAIVSQSETSTIDPSEVNFDACLQELTRTLNETKVRRIQDVFPEFEHAFDRKTFNEPIEECINHGYADRCDAVRQTLAELVERRSVVESACRECIVDIYRAIYRALDAYLMATSMLVNLKSFEIDKNGFVQIASEGLAAACERRRKRVKELVARMLDWEHLPFHEEAFRFDEAETLEERKSLIHRRAAEWRMATTASDESVGDSHPRTAIEEKREMYRREITNWREIGWEFDRIMSYVPFGRTKGLEWAENANRRKFGSIEDSMNWVREEAAKACANPDLYVPQAKETALETELNQKDVPQESPAGDRARKEIDPKHDASALHYALGALRRSLELDKESRSLELDEEKGENFWSQRANRDRLCGLLQEVETAMPTRPRGIEATMSQSNC